MNLKFLQLFIAVCFFAQQLNAQHSITNLGTNYTQDFNSLASTGSTSTVLPTHWAMSASSYTIGTGSSNTGATYSFGQTGNTDRALGSLGSAGNPDAKFGISFMNSTTSHIQTLTITYTGEMWRLGSKNFDTLFFSYSTNATSLTAGTWNFIPQLYFVTPDTTGTAGARNGNLSPNRQQITFTITGLNIAPNSTFWIRWNDADGFGADDGLAIDSLTVAYTGAVLPVCTTPSNNVSGVALTANITSIVGSLNKAVGSQKTLVVYSTNTTLDNNPTNTTDYAIGESLGGGTIAYVGNASTINLNIINLTQNTFYKFFFFPFNDSCNGGPIYKTSGIITDTVRTKKAPLPLSYYSSIDTSLSCANLKTELKNRITNNHTPITYAQVTAAFEKTDISNGFIIERYSPCQYTYTTVACSGNNTECECYNRDHVIPQSWFGDWDNYPMYSDMHHIFPSDGYVNSAQKGNLPLGIVNGAGNYSNGAGVKVGNSSILNGYTGQVFEPGNTYKGDFARTYLYFVTRYQDSIADFKSRFSGSQFNNTIYTGLEPWILKILVKWHKQDPPDDIEILRNDSIFTIQGNRNPFIDFPHWVEKVFGINGDTCGQFTTCSQPTNVPTNLIFTSVTQNSISGKFNKPAGGAEGYVVIYRKTKFQLPNLRDSVSYSVGQLITEVNGLFIDSAIVADTSLNANDTTFTINGLDSLSKYYIAVLPFNKCSYGKNYRSLFLNDVNKNDTTTLGFAPCPEPPAIPGSITFTNITKNSISGKFGRVFTNTSGYIVIYNKNSFIPNLKDSVSYTLGQYVNTTDSARVGYISTDKNDTVFTINSLDSTTRYYIAVIPYNNCAGFGNNYRNLIINNVNKDDTLTIGNACNTPSTSVQTLTLSNVTTQSATGNFINTTPNPAGYLVVYSTNGFIAFPPDTNVQYVPQQTIGTGNQQAKILKIATPNDTTFEATNLLPNTKYHFWVFPFNNCNGTIKIRRSSVKRDSITTLIPICTEPNGVTTILVSSVSSTEINGSFTTSGANSYLIMRSTSNTVPTITDTTNYNVGQTIDSATVIAIGNSSTFSSTGLTPNTRYYFFVFAFNSECSGGPDYNTTNVAQIDTVTNLSSGIKTNKETAFKIYPNPVTNSKLNIEFNQFLNEPTTIRIVDMLGKILIEYKLAKNTKNYQFDVSNWSKGMYYIQIGNPTNYSTVPFVKQ